MTDLVEKIRKEAAIVFILVLSVLYAGNALMAALITPLTHIGTTALMPQHLWLAMFWSALAVAGPIAWLLCRPTSMLARHLAAVVIGLECSLATALSGGQIELHFTFFIAMVFLAMAADVKLLWTFVLVVLIDHSIRGYAYPDSVYGCSMWKNGRPPLWLAFEHAGFVALQLAGLTFFIKRRLQGMGALDNIRAQLMEVEKSRTDEIMSGLNADMLVVIKDLEISKEKVAIAAKSALEQVARETKGAVAKASAETQAAVTKVAQETEAAIKKVAAAADAATELAAALAKERDAL